MMLNSASENLQFNSIEQLDQGAGTLYTITSQLVKGGDISKTLDMKGREAAVALVDVFIKQIFSENMLTCYTI